MRCLFASDIHGHERRWLALFDAIERELPQAVFLGGDLLPAVRRSAAGVYPVVNDFIRDFLVVRLDELRSRLREDYPAIFLIPGNDDARTHEDALIATEDHGLWTYAHGRIQALRDYDVLGYAFVPPTPFRCKDWERYDVSRYVDPGCISPEDGFLTVPRDQRDLRYGTIEDDLKEMSDCRDLSRTICLFHSPPYDTVMDRAALDGRFIDHVPLDVHVGSIAIRKFILDRVPRISLHGHIHESASITGTWKQQLGATWCYSAAHKGKELALVRFDPDHPADAERELL
ncbi:MAG: metallophosphoesterase [Bacteroidia bacterium]|nr:metallophosphoesterase [Bacteroidia bacterium]